MAVKLLSKYNTITEALGFNLTAEQAKKFGFNPLKRTQDTIETVAAMYNYDTTTSTLSEYGSNTAVKAYTYYDTTKSYFFREFDDLKHEGLFQAITNPYSTDSTTKIPACTCSGRKITGTGTNQPGSSFFVYKNNSIVSLSIYWEQLKYNTQKWIGDYGKTEPYVGGTYDVRTTSHTHAFVDQRTEILKTVTDANSVITGFKDFKWLTKNKRIFLWSNVTDGSLAKAGEWIPHYSLFFIAQTEEIKTRLKAKLDVLKENCTKTVDEYDTLMMEITGATSKTQNLFYNGVLLAYRGPGSIIYIFPPTTGIHSAFCPDDGLTAYPLTEHGYIDYDSIIYGVQYTRALGAAGVNPNILDKIEGCYYIDCLAYNEKEKPSIPTTVTIDQYDYSENDNLGVLTITLGQDVDEEGIVYEHRLFREPWYATAPKAPLTFSNRQESTIEIEYTNSQGVSTTITRPVITYDVSFSAVGKDQTAVVMVDVEVPIHGGYDNYSFQLNFITINAIITIELEEVTCTLSTIPEISAILTYQHWTTFTSEQLAGLSQKNSDGTFNVSAIMAYIIANIMTVTPPEIENTYQIITYYDGLNLGMTKNRRGEDVHCIQIRILGVSDPTYADTNTALKGKHVWTYTAVGRPSEVCPYASADFTVNIETIYATGGTDFITGQLSPNTGQWDGSGEYDEDFDYSTTCPSGNFFFYDSRGVDADLTNFCIGERDSVSVYQEGQYDYFKKDIDGVYYYMDKTTGCFYFAEPITQGQAAHTVQIKITVMPISLYLSKNKGYAIYQSYIPELESINTDVFVGLFDDDLSHLDLTGMKTALDFYKKYINPTFQEVEIPIRFNEAYNYLVRNRFYSFNHSFNRYIWYKIGNSNIFMRCANISFTFKNEATLALDLSKIDEDIYTRPWTLPWTDSSENNIMQYFWSLKGNIVEEGNKLYTYFIATAGYYDNIYINGLFYPYEKETNNYYREGDFEDSSYISIISKSILGFFGAEYNNFDNSKSFYKLIKTRNNDSSIAEYRYNIDDVYLNLYARGIKVFQTKSGKKILAFTTNREYENLYGYSFDHFKQNGVIKNRLRIAYTAFSGGNNLEYYKTMATNKGGMLYDWKVHELMFLLETAAYLINKHEYLISTYNVPFLDGYFQHSSVYSDLKYMPIYIDNTSLSGSICTFTDVSSGAQYNNTLPIYDYYDYYSGNMFYKTCINTSFPFVSYTKGDSRDRNSYFTNLFPTTPIAANIENTTLLHIMHESNIQWVYIDKTRQSINGDNVITGIYLRDKCFEEGFFVYINYPIQRIELSEATAFNCTIGPEKYFSENADICLRNFLSSINITPSYGLVSPGVSSSDGVFSFNIYNLAEHDYDHFIEVKISVNLGFTYTAYQEWIDYGYETRYHVEASSCSVKSISNTVYNIREENIELSYDYSGKHDTMFADYDVSRYRYSNIFKADLNPTVINARFITFDDVSQ